MQPRAFGGGLRILDRFDREWGIRGPLPVASGNLQNILKLKIPVKMTQDPGLYLLPLL